MSPTERLPEQGFLFSPFAAVSGRLGHFYHFQISVNLTEMKTALLLPCMQSSGQTSLKEEGARMAVFHLTLFS